MLPTTPNFYICKLNLFVYWMISKCQLLWFFSTFNCIMIILQVFPLW